MYKINQDIELEVIVAISQDGDPVIEKDEFSEGDLFGEDELLSLDEKRYEVQWSNGDVTYIPTFAVTKIKTDD
jgi:uncharacterized Zn finger protein